MEGDSVMGFRAQARQHWNAMGSYNRRITCLYACKNTSGQAKMHAQAITLAVLSGAAIYHYYEKQGESAAHEVSTIRSPLSYRSPANFESISTMIFQKPINQAISKPIKYKTTSGNISGKTSAVAVPKKALKAPSVISFTNL
uniref:HIG1 domain-containing protein n=1 Tax=Salix viminalis TaxID=40686 RepID=A0A6N2L8Q0_SALVM